MTERRSIIITGGASGIGKASVEIAVERGWAVTIADRNPAGASLAEEITRNGGTAQFIDTDVSSEASVKALVDAAVSAYGQLHYAINSAGITGCSKPIHEVDVDHWDRVNAINLRGMFLCLKYQVAAMWPYKYGAIVGMSSAASQKGLPWSSDYCASKAGIDGMIRGAAIDCAEQNIRINALLPGPTLTPLATGSSNANPALAKTRIRPMERMADPREIAEAAIFLVSDAASFVTGIAMPVDGGMIIA
ncbi:MULTISPECIES: SDR family NAD(P)-dependent oxidoreductase [unclassified Novosphingobium]|uniref:SDR family NAD(P)-dependent oxidoreductase n=1 Tax=unclassified Novosphingobium TaxID=2644732 RepID=UPI000D4902CA|nr:MULTISPECIES: SDR family oxidoreductase [unclassified Novosphingobium]PTR05799.1 NAD(P)-dependent dehydrogenase (short-subunit alcohol dehydrogenase family) [Novosphingobium sp. GV055]PUA94357.1 NAD(P)-dependent dehydrogenase (short-subunit alcohol dehydrogenase family) [Novosphingobium sp. GV061]PUB12663.1 NAD(P)-dependent dehydrogenase (short-subunit alcohol dehydrogenase family) [Novosphingobium sp. GV079]PUB38028.1 NAD(P)-dependent dehydrogenase (short-subunit alcohol dehydrogenase famil